jgi:hypothetical protein
MIFVFYIYIVTVYSKFYSLSSVSVTMLARFLCSLPDRFETLLEFLLHQHRLSVAVFIRMTLFTLA